LLIVPHGALDQVPFAALPDPAGASAGFPAGAPLLERHEIVVVPSASALAALRARSAARPPRRGGLTLFADRRLPHVGEEVAALSALAARWGGRVALYRVLHVAAHAVPDPRLPGRSALLLSRLDRRGRPRDGLLRGGEIAALDLPADLVVLAACRTGPGEEVRGDGPAGLARAFLAAGAARVLVSLWDVGDEATARLMAGFYRRLLAEGLAPAAALRAAQLDLRRDPRWRAPWAWAGFVLLGDWR